MRLWGPQEGESSKAFSAFETFRILGPARSLREAAGIHYGREDGPSQGEYDTLRRWSARHDWAERVEHFDRWLQMEKRDAVQRHVAERAEDHAKRETRLRERALEARERAMDKVLGMLSWPLSEQRREMGEGPDGEEQAVYVFEPTRWSFSSVAPLFALTQSGGPTEEDLERIAVMDTSALSEEELGRLVEIYEKVAWKVPEQTTDGNPGEGSPSGAGG